MLFLLGVSFFDVFALFLSPWIGVVIHHPERCFRARFRATLRQRTAIWERFTRLVAVFTIMERLLIGLLASPPLAICNRPLQWWP